MTDGVVAGTSVWVTAQIQPAPTALPRRAEVVVIGGGITGVALLDVLCRRGIDAILVERDRLASGASGRNAGFLLAGSAENYAKAVEHFGRAAAAELWAFTLENHALIATVATTLDTGHRVRGSLVVALDAAEVSSLETSATLLAEDGLPGVITAAPDVPGALCALFNPADGEIDPVRLVRGIAAAHASRVFESRPVVAVEDGDSSATVHLADASIETHSVVLATNAWTAELVPTLRIRPVRAQMLATAPAPPLIPCPVYAEWGHRYWRQRDDGRVLAGGFRHRALTDEVGHSLATTAVVQHDIEAQLRELGVTAEVTHRWAGTMGFSDDGLPLVGLAPGWRRVHVSAGYTGHGMGLAVNAATVLAARIVDQRPLPAWLDAGRLLASSGDA